MSVSWLLKASDRFLLNFSTLKSGIADGHRLGRRLRCNSQAARCRTVGSSLPKGRLPNANGNNHQQSPVCQALLVGTAAKNHGAGDCKKNAESRIKMREFGDRSSYPNQSQNTEMVLLLIR